MPTSELKPGSHRRFSWRPFPWWRKETTSTVINPLMNRIVAETIWRLGIDQAIEEIKKTTASRRQGNK